MKLSGKQAERHTTQHKISSITTVFIVTNRITQKSTDCQIRLSFHLRLSFPRNQITTYDRDATSTNLISILENVLHGSEDKDRCINSIEYLSFHTMQTSLTKHEDM